jgi:hypothetical protein
MASLSDEWHLSRLTEHHQGLRADDPAAVADLVDDSLEIVDVLDSDPRKRVGVARHREHGLDLVYAVSDRRDVIDARRSGKAQFGERLDRATELGVIDHHGVPENDPSRLESIDAPLDGRSRQTNILPNLGQGRFCVTTEQGNDLLVDGIRFKICRAHQTIRLDTGSQTQLCCVCQQKAGDLLFLC